VVGVPKTIDNDLELNERSFGFDSAASVVADALGRLKTTAQSHGRVMVVETMGRYAGWIALDGGLAGGADAILMPELAYEPEALASFCAQRAAEQGFALVCVAEGAKLRTGDWVVQRHLANSPDPLRLGGIGQRVTAEIEALLGAQDGESMEVRYTLLGHLQRGGSPTTFDRVLATRFGVAAADLVLRRQYGRMVALQGDRCTDVALSDVAGRHRQVPLDHELLFAARQLGVFLGQ